MRWRPVLQIHLLVKPSRVPLFLLSLSYPPTSRISSQTVCSSRILCTSICVRIAAFALWSSNFSGKISFCSTLYRARSTSLLSIRFLQRFLQLHVLLDLACVLVLLNFRSKHDDASAHLPSFPSQRLTGVLAPYHTLTWHTSFALLAFTFSCSCFARFSANFSRSSANFAFFSSSVNGLIFTNQHYHIDYIGACCPHDRPINTHLFSWLLKFLMARSFSMEASRPLTSKNLATLATFDRLGVHQTRISRLWSQSDILGQPDRPLKLYRNFWYVPSQRLDHPRQCQRHLQLQTVWKSQELGYQNGLRGDP